MAEQIITREMLQSVKGGTLVRGVCYISDYQTLLTKNKKEYIQGTLMSGMNVPFKAWNSSSAFTAFKNENYNGVIAYISGTGDDYGGSVSIIIDEVQAVSGFTVDQFLLEKYDIKAYWDALKYFVQQRVTEKGYKLLDTILFSNEALAERFKLEFAASRQHDNCKGGLLAHTYKVVTFVGAILGTYNSVHRGNSDFTDITYIGAVLHDLGKVREIKLGVYEDNPCTHPFLGAEMVYPYREQIVAAYGERWYYTLLSIITEHHGVYGEPCKSIPSYIVHTADMLDSRMTAIGQKLEDVTDVQQVVVSVDDFKLRWH